MYIPLQDELVSGERTWRPSCSGEGLREPGKHPLPAGELCRSDQVPSAGEKHAQCSPASCLCHCSNPHVIYQLLLLCQYRTGTLCQQNSTLSLISDTRLFILQLFSDFVDAICCRFCIKWTWSEGNYILCTSINKVLIKDNWILNLISQYSTLHSPLVMKLK